VEIRYLGFEQDQNARSYRFEVREKGQASTQLTVKADMDAFRACRVGIQEGPTLSSNKLSADLEKGWTGEHELTGADVRAYADGKALADAQRAEMRKAPRRKPARTDATERSPWRNFGI
jgi:hypothetical protein